jgi:hypothetical protein
MAHLPTAERLESSDQPPTPPTGDIPESEIPIPEIVAARALVAAAEAMGGRVDWEAFWDALPDEAAIDALSSAPRVMGPWTESHSVELSVRSEVETGGRHASGYASQERGSIQVGKDSATWEATDRQGARDKVDAELRKRRFILLR